MTQCKKGDKLLLRNGEIATMINSSKTVLIYPYIIDINGVLSSVTEEGLQLEGTTQPHDVIGFEFDKQELIDKVLETIKADVINGDVTAIEELLKQVPIESLKSYLPEEGE
jgi:hypothetical protein